MWKRLRAVLPLRSIVGGIALLILSGCAPEESIVSEAEVAALPDRVDFNFHVRPILSDRCFHCHGPDRETREAGLRIDNPEGGLEHILDSGGRAFVAGNVGASEAYGRITTDDPDDVMPPASSNLVLSDYEKAIIRKWIEQGAEYKKHWAYEEIVRPEIPGATDLEENPIDAFVAASLVREGLALSEEADKESLIRRVTFDLTGLPPTVEEIDAFLADDSPNAYESLVDDLLARSSYGERMAVEWMDVARYADTHGYSMDRYRDMSPWRDWVIQSFNENKPFDEFVAWQLAGDLLPDPTIEQRLATAFNRLHPQNGEGGIVNEEFLVEYAADRVQTLGTAFLGATMECVRCHDHKYDPILQEEFYSLSSFFNNVDESGQISFDVNDMPVPTMLLPHDAEKARLDALEATARSKLRAVESLRDASDRAFEDWKGTIELAELDFNGGDALLARFPLMKDDTSKRIRNYFEPESPGRVLFGANLKSEDGPELETLVEGSREVVRLNGDDPLYFPSATGFERGKPFSVSIEAWIPEALKEGALFHYNKAGILYNYKGFEVSLLDGRWDVRLAHTFPYNSIHLESVDPVAKEVWQRVTLTYDGSSKAAGVTLWVDDAPVEMVARRDNLYKEFKPGKEDVLKEIAIKVGGRWRSKGLPGALVDELRVYRRELSPLEVAWLAKGDAVLDGVSDADWREYYAARYNEAHRDGLVALAEARSEWNALSETIREVMIMDEMPEPRQAYLLSRGLYDAKLDPVENGTPSEILPFPEDLPTNRLGLAQWLTSREHPLTSRVTINRYWQLFFGNGIVGTPEDFGSQGSLPSHPELLDWLAAEFMESGWDVKGMLRLIATSATYRQSSKGDASLLAMDPENRLLARGPRKRLTAEMIRDNALAASGLLVSKIGGPSVYPYQPEGLWKMNSGTYEQGSGEDLYRRSLYTIWKRSVPPPMMNGFDAPTRAYCVPKRQQTSTPLQALNLMNDPQIVEAARVLAERTMGRSADSEERLRYLYRSLTSRFPSSGELAALSSVYENGLKSFGDSSEKVDAFLTVGERPVGEGVNRVEVAALGVVANMVMNHDAVVTKR